MRKVAEKLAGEAAVAQINVQENPNLAARFGVKGVPVLVLLHQGRVVDQLAGAGTVESVLAWFRRHH